MEAMRKDRQTNNKKTTEENWTYLLIKKQQIVTASGGDGRPHPGYTYLDAPISSSCIK